jgi:acetyltransferase-like isoleucine patch superfamily enzyme
MGMSRVIRRIWQRSSSFVRTRPLLRCGSGSELGSGAILENPRSIAIGNGVSIRSHAWLNCGESNAGQPLLEIGDGVSIGRFAHINARQSVVIEPYVLIADRVFITDYHHGRKDPTRPILAQPLEVPRPVRLRTGCWIGEGAVIMPGVTVGRNAVVGANAVVTKDVPDGAVAVGVPARSTT